MNEVTWVGHEGIFSFSPLFCLSTGSTWTLVRLSMTHLIWLILTRYDSARFDDSLWLLCVVTPCVAQRDSYWLYVHVYKTPSSRDQALSLISCAIQAVFTSQTPELAVPTRTPWDSLPLISYRLSDTRASICSRSRDSSSLYHSKPRTHDVSPDAVTCQWHKIKLIKPHQEHNERTTIIDRMVHRSRHHRSTTSWTEVPIPDHPWTEGPSPSWIHKQP